MKTILTRKHELLIGCKPTPPGFKPGAWGSWLLDDHFKVFPNSLFALGSGAFKEDYKREAYDKSMALLRNMNEADGQIAFEKLKWI